MPISKKNRPIKVSTPLGEDVLLFHRMLAKERLGGLFEYKLDLLSENASIDPDKLLGENVSVGVSLPGVNGVTSTATSPSSASTT